MLSMLRTFDDGGRRPRPRRLSGDSGAVAVEFAFVMPVLVMLIFGIYAFSMAWNAKTELTGAVREGARASALKKSDATAKQAVVSAAPGLALSTNDVAVTPCPNNAPSGTNATVKATYKLPYSIPLFREGLFTITATGVMRCGL